MAESPKSKVVSMEIDVEAIERLRDWAKISEWKQVQIVSAILRQGFGLKLNEPHRAIMSSLAEFRRLASEKARRQR